MSLLLLVKKLVTYENNLLLKGVYLSSILDFSTFTLIFT